MTGIVFANKAFVCRFFPIFYRSRWQCYM